jgi:hypothetical protein
MTQLLPSTEYESKAVALIMDMRSLISESRDKINPREVESRFRNIQTRFSEIIGKPMTQYEPFFDGEPARSDKVNRFLSALQKDINILEEQVELMRASAVHIHNNMKTQLEQAKFENEQALNKLKTLQLYTSAQNNEITIFGDYLNSDNLIDYTVIDPVRKTVLEKPGQISLSKVNSTNEDLMSAASVRVLSTSNGIPGRLVEVQQVNPRMQQPGLVYLPVVDPNDLYRFTALRSPMNNLDNITDGSPVTWFEYEKNLVEEADRINALDFGFRYKFTDSNINRQDLNFVDYGLSKNELLDWANGPSGNSLKLDLEFDLKAPKNINKIDYMPFDLEGNKNHPTTIKSVEVSLDKNEWETVYPTNVVVTSSVNLENIDIDGNISINNASWSLDNKEVRYVRFSIEQSRSIDTKIGHIYYKTRLRTLRQIDPDSAAPSIIERVVGGDRVEGPIPTTANPTKYYDPSFSIVEDANSGDNLYSSLVKNVEIFNGKRWAIGIRDISIGQSEYSKFSEIITKPFRINGVIDRVSLEASSYIPEVFPADTLWIKYFISPDNGLSWQQISRIQDDYLGIPEIIAYNDRIPSEFKEANIGYYNTRNPVSSIRLKVQLSRPSDQAYLTPLLYWYKLKVKRR